MSTWNPIRASGRFWHRFGPYLEKLEDAILRVSGGRHPLDVAFATEEEDSKPWQRPSPMPARITGPLPKTLTLVLANQIFIAKADLPQPLANRLIRIAAFQNPEFYKAQAMRLPVWNKPRIIGCAENHPRYIGLPCGCLDAVLDLLKENDIRPQLQDERLPGRKVTAKFTGTLRKDQKTAVREMLKHEVGVLCAPTAFGKTVTAAALIARRKVSTLVLVHRTELLRQWQERLNGFLEFPKGGLGAPAICHFCGRNWGMRWSTALSCTAVCRRNSGQRYSPNWMSWTNPPQGCCSPPAV